MPTKKKAMSPLVKMMLAGDHDAVHATLGEEKPPELLGMLTDESVPVERRVEMLRIMISNGSDSTADLLATILSRASSDASAELKKKTATLQELIEAIEAGPFRTARFVRMIKRNGSAPRALVTLHDGSPAATPVVDAKLARRLRCGDGVLMDAQGRAVLHREDSLPETGETAILERRLNDHQVLVTLNHDERRVLHASASLVDKLEAGEVEPGAAILVNGQQGFAFDAIAVDDELSHYRYLDRSRVPSRVEMACPPAYIGSLVKHAEMAMRAPEQLRKWKLPLSRFVLLEGVTGSGKSLSIELLRLRLAELTAEVHGISIEDVPPSIFRIRPSEIYDKWLGASDRNLKRVFDEVEQMASRPIQTPAGVTIERRPIIGVIEELEGIARSRGGQNDPVYDRILVTLLQSLDPGRSALVSCLVFWICTTNLPQAVDSAAMRRVADHVERFSHLSRPAFTQVLSAKLDDLPVAPSDDVVDQDERRRRLTGQIANWLYCPNGDDPGQVELVYANGEPEKKYRRDFLTGAVVARSVQQATSELCAEEFDRSADVGLTAERLMDALNQQIGAMAAQLSPQNVASLLRIKEGGHVSHVRLIGQPEILPHHLRRAS